jgi:predicted amidohydrolase YtcJ
MKAHGVAHPAPATPADLVVLSAEICTMDARRPWARAMAVRDGRIVAVGDNDVVVPLIGPDTTVVDHPPGMVMPGLVDAHCHVSSGGQQQEWELMISPMLDLPQVLDAVRRWAHRLRADEWVIGGLVGNHVMSQVGDPEALAALDEASQGRPVLLRDASTHNRWVNSRALELLGIDATTPDPPRGRYLRGPDGSPLGVLLEQASQLAERDARETFADLQERDLRSARTALEILHAEGVTAVQDAGTMETWLATFHALDQAGELDTWFVASLPNIRYMVAGDVFPELADVAEKYRTRHIRPDFAKVLLDGVPTTRSSAFLEPYKEVPGVPAEEGEEFQPGYRGKSSYTHEGLVAVFEEAVARGLHVKAHATADFSVRQVLDCVQEIRARHGYGTIFHIAHTLFVDPADIERFRELDVVADASPVLWFPQQMNDFISHHVQDRYMERMWPLRELHEAGATIVAGSDWPSVAHLPDPWLSIETMVTRRNPNPAVPGALCPDQALDLATALAAHTVRAAEAIGLGEETGCLRPGLSADWILLDRHLFEIPVDQVHQTVVQETWFGGRQVYDAETG